MLGFYGGVVFGGDDVVWLELDEDDDEQDYVGLCCQCIGGVQLFDFFLEKVDQCCVCQCVLDVVDIVYDDCYEVLYDILLVDF